MVPCIVDAQEDLSRKEIRKELANYFYPGKHWTVEVPLWIPGYVGSFAYGDINLEGEDGVDPIHPIEPPDNIWGNIKIFNRLFKDEWYLRFFFLTKIAYEKNRFLGQLDGLYGSIGESLKFKYNNITVVQANYQTTNFRLFGGYRFVDIWSGKETFRYELYGYLGTRVHAQKIYSDLNRQINKLDINPIWAEPIIGLQNQFTWKRWYIFLQGDYGGYFHGSKTSSQVTMNV